MLPERCFLSSNFGMVCAQKREAQNVILFNWFEVLKLPKGPLTP
jgi:hypothetical protein